QRDTPLVAISEKPPIMPADCFDVKNMVAAKRRVSGAVAVDLQGCEICRISGLLASDLHRPVGTLGSLLAYRTSWGRNRDHLIFGRIAGAPGTFKSIAAACSCRRTGD